MTGLRIYAFLLLVLPFCLQQVAESISFDIRPTVLERKQLAIGQYDVDELTAGFVTDLLGTLSISEIRLRILR